MAEEPATTNESSDQHDSDTVSLLGREITLPGGIYTVVFIGLGILTLIEVIIGSGSSSGVIIPVLLALALVKGALVMWFYMHLRSDSRLFLFIFLFPLAITLLSIWFLLSIPSTY